MLCDLDATYQVIGERKGQQARAWARPMPRDCK